MNELTDQQKKIMLEKDTEAPFSGEYVHTKEKGMYACAQCGNPLFASDAKFDSGTGWPSFDQAIAGSTRIQTDESHGMVRTEVVCAKCGGHLGHLFNDGPKETTGNRFCINSACLLLNKEEQK